MARLAPLIDPFDVIVVTDRRHGQTVRGLVPKALVLAEPMHRNTAASIALATVAIDRPDDEPMLVVVADHDIEDEEAFRDAIGTIDESLSEATDDGASPLMAFAVTPTERRSRPQLHPPTVRRRRSARGRCASSRSRATRPTRTRPVPRSSSSPGRPTGAPASSSGSVARSARPSSATRRCSR